MQKLESQFRDGLIQKGWSKDQVSEMWRLILKQSEYSFNRGHAVAYGLLSYLTAYLKTHYPIQYMTACLIAKKDDAGKIGIFINECSRLGIRVVPPSVNHSQIDFIPNPQSKKILFGLGAIKGLGTDTAQQIIDSRPYHGFDDFLSRVNGGKPGSKNVIQLIKAGAIPTNSKSEMLLRYGNHLFESEYKEKSFKELASLPTISALKNEWGIDTDTIKNKQDRLAAYNQKRKEKWDSEKLDRLTQKEHKRNQYLTFFRQKYMQNPHMWEFETLSMFLTVNPIQDSYKYISKTFDQTDDGESVTVICVVLDIERKKDKRGSQFCYLHIYTPSGILEAVCWAKQYSIFFDQIKKGNDLVIYGKKKGDCLVAEQIKPYKTWLHDRKITV